MQASDIKQSSVAEDEPDIGDEKQKKLLRDISNEDKQFIQEQRDQKKKDWPQRDKNKMRMINIT